MVEERVQRRLAAILAADVVGYSRLMEQDETGTLERLKSLRSEVFDPTTQQFNGRIFKNTGDGALAEFGSAVDAVQCAADIQRSLAQRNAGLPEGHRVILRIGISLGDVIVEGDDLYGNGVNVAARMEGLAEPGAICVSANVHEHVRNIPDISFEDLGEQSVKNIDRPVRTYRARVEFDIDARPEKQVALSPPPLPDKPSIAVLPFENMSGDKEQEYFADGMTEDIITELSRFENLFVIARNTSFTYKNQRTDVKEVARDLGVHFVLEGSVRKSGAQVRITAQLINGQDGGHVWAERYDGALENLFDLQDQVSSQVVGSIFPQIAEAELERVGRGERKFDDAHELAWLAQETERSAFRLGDWPMLDRAIAMAIEAVEKNSKCGVAYQTICHAYTMKSLARLGEDPTASADLAEEWARKFFSQLPNSYMAYLSLGRAKFRRCRFQDANRDFQRAHELNPNDSMVLRSWAWCEASAGEFENAIRHAHLAIRLSPKDTQLGVAYLALAMAAYIAKDADNFEDWADKAIRSQPWAPIRRALMIAYAAEAENQTLLETHRAELMRYSPDFVDSLFRGENQLFQKSEHTAMLLEGLRKAGLRA